jgi:hypothetical protein
MVTDYPRQITVSELGRATEKSSLWPLMNAALACVQQIICGLRGHDSVLQFDQSRVFLQCMSCSYQSPGWRVETVSPHLRVVPVRRAPASMAVVQKVA